MIAQIFEIVMIILLLAFGILLVIVTNGMAESKRRLMEMDAEIERRKLEENLKK